MLLCLGKKKRVTPWESLQHGPLHFLSSSSKLSCKAFLIFSIFRLWHISCRTLTLALGDLALLPTSCPFSSVCSLENLQPVIYIQNNFPFPSSSQSIAIILFEFQLWELPNLFSRLFVSGQTAVLTTFFFSTFFFSFFFLFYFWHSGKNPQ